MDNLLKALYCLKDELEGACHWRDCVLCPFYQENYVGYGEIIDGAIKKIKVSERK